MEFQVLADRLLKDAEDIIAEWLPQGRRIGNEWVCGDLTGGEGRSCSVNVTTGRWGDFAGEERGGDLISLYAAINKTTNSDAYRVLEERYGNGEARRRDERDSDFPGRVELIENETLDIGAPDPGTPLPVGVPSPAAWVYWSESGVPIFYIMRIDGNDGKKRYAQFSWSRIKRAWVPRAFMRPRPLYNLPEISADTKRPVLVVEGEKSAEAAKKLVGGRYAVTTWAGGANATETANWSVLYGRECLLWPDCDKPGREAMESVAKILSDGSPAATVRVMDPGDKPLGWDAADALSEGWDWEKLKNWARERISIVASSTKDTAPQYIDPMSYPTQQDLWAAFGIEWTKSYGPKKNVATISTVLARWIATTGKIWYDSFAQRVYTTWHHTGQETQPREWADVDTLAMTRAMSLAIRFHPSDELVYKGVILYAHDNQRCQIKEWLKGLKWDGTERLDHFWPDFYETEASEYHKTVGRNFWISMVARVFEPGCKSDCMVVLEGPQGSRKSMSLEVIASPLYYAEMQQRPDDKDFYMTMPGKLILEISELDAFNKSDVSTIKRCLSCRSDRYRAPYGRSSQDWARQCIFVGTTNDDHYLRDDTGARRFWPIRCGDRIDIEGLRIHREQLFAEATRAYLAGEKWWTVPASEAEIQQEKRRMSDPWEEVIAEWMIAGSTMENKTASEVLTQCLHIEPGRQEFKHKHRIGMIARRFGFSTVTSRIADGRSAKVYRRGV